MSDDQATAIRAAEASIVDLMPAVADMVATVVERPKMEWDDYAGLLEAADVTGPLLVITLVRFAAGMCVIAELSPDDIREMGQPDPGAGRHRRD